METQTNTDQIAAEAWKRMVATGQIQDTPSVEADFMLIVKSAIEKAHSKGMSDSIVATERLEASRAAHASERSLPEHPCPKCRTMMEPIGGEAYACKKCGYSSVGAAHASDRRNMETQTNTDQIAAEAQQIADEYTFPESALNAKLSDRIKSAIEKAVRPIQQERDELAMKCEEWSVAYSDACKSSAQSSQRFARNLVKAESRAAHASEHELLLDIRKSIEGNIGYNERKRLADKIDAVITAHASKEACQDCGANVDQGEQYCPRCQTNASEEGANANTIDKAIREVLNFHPWSYKELYKRMVKMCYALSQRPTPATGDTKRLMEAKHIIAMFMDQFDNGDDEVPCFKFGRKFLSDAAMSQTKEKE